MPGDFSIVLEPRNQVDTGRPYPERRQPMRGFEGEYVDIVDYIVRITHRIWEDQDVGYIYDTYSPGCVVYDDGGEKHGVERVVEETMQAINTFPDVRHYADEVIWAGDEDRGFATSHRAVNVGHHGGSWRWGPATGRKIHMWVIANCVSRENQIFEEWVLYNTAARLAQCGIDVRSAAREFANEGGLAAMGEREAGEVERLIGGRSPVPYPGSASRGFDVEYFVRALYHDVYNRRDLSAIDRAYAQTVSWHGPSNRQGFGRSAVRGLARSLLSVFPDLGLGVDEVYWMGNRREGFRVAVRWSAAGTHRGYGLYGAPTGRRVHFWGLSQLYLEGGRIVADWTLFNEFALLGQLVRDEPLPLLG
jgi:predicted ester cyclase